ERVEELAAHREVERVRAAAEEAGPAGGRLERAGKERERRSVERQDGRRCEQRRRQRREPERVHRGPAPHQWPRGRFGSTSRKMVAAAKSTAEQAQHNAA